MAKPVTAFDWDDGNIGHLARHSITPLEAEEVLRNRPLFLGVTLREGEQRHQELGETRQGRILLLVTTPREGKIRVVTGWQVGRGMQAYWREQRLESPPYRLQEPFKEEP